MIRSRDGTPIVKETDNNGTINTMNKYFKSEPGPAPAPEAPPEAPPPLFPREEKDVLKPHGNPRYGMYRRVTSTKTGALYGDCGNCTQRYVNITQFAPDECLNNGRTRPAFLALVEEYKASYEARDLEGAREARGKIAALRSARCPPCRKTHNKLTGPEKACYECWREVRQAACEHHGGCMKSACCEKGPSAWQVLEADHIDPDDKTHDVSDYYWWSCNDGPEAMREEAAKCQWLCRFCHRIELTGTQANRRGDAAGMEDGKRSGTVEEQKQYHAKRKAKIVYPKQSFVDTEKLRRGKCLTCPRKVTLETAFAFDFDHRDAATKMIGKDTLAKKQGGVSGLVNNHAKRAALDEIRDVLVAEMLLCDLLCANCHKRKTHGYGEAEEAEEAEEAGDAA